MILSEQTATHQRTTALVFLYSEYENEKHVVLIFYVKCIIELCFQVFSAIPKEIPPQGLAFVEFCLHSIGILILGRRLRAAASGISPTALSKSG